jgi:hypothetical protein
MHNFFLVYFVSLYMFLAYLGPSSGGTTVCIQQLVLIILFRWLSNPTMTTDSHIKRITGTNCCIHKVLLLSSSIGTTTLRWVSACWTIVEHSQQEGFTECRCQRHVKPPIWRRTRDLERSNFRHKRPPASEATLTNPAAEGGTMGEKWPRILPKVATSTFFYMQ